MVKLLVIDLAFRNTGWAKISLDKTAKGDDILECGCIKTVPPAEGASVALNIVSEVKRVTNEIMAQINDPDVAILAVELPHGGAKSAAALRSLGIAMATLGAISNFTTKPILWITPNNNKKAATGNRFADKKDMQAAIKTRWPNTKVLPKLQNQLEHIADAACLYFSVYNKSEVNKLR